MFFKTNSFSWDKVFFRFLDRLKRWNHLFASRVCVEAYLEYLQTKLHDEAIWKPTNNHFPCLLFYFLSQIIVHQTISRFLSIHAMISYSWRCEMRQTTPQSASFYAIIRVISLSKIRHITRWFTSNHFTLHNQRHHHPQLTLKQLPPFARVTTPLSLRRGAGGEAERGWCLGFISLYFICNFTITG